MGRRPEVTTDACALFSLCASGQASGPISPTHAQRGRRTRLRALLWSHPRQELVANTPIRARGDRRVRFALAAPSGLFSRLSDRFRCSFHRRADLKRDMLAVHRACASPAGSQHLVAAVRSDRPLPLLSRCSPNPPSCQRASTAWQHDISVRNKTCSRHSQVRIYTAGVFGGGLPEEIGRWEHGATEGAFCNRVRAQYASAAHRLVGSQTCEPICE